jgi:hypothetical protein
MNDLRSKAVEKVLLFCLFIGLSTTTMEKVENIIEELPLYKKIWLLEGYMRGEVEIQDNDGSLFVLFTRHYSKRSALNIVRLRDAIVYLSQAKKDSRLVSIDSHRSPLSDEIILQLQLVRYRIYYDGEDLSFMEEAQKKTIKQARDDWDTAFLSQATKPLIEQELKNKKVFAARLEPLQAVITSTRSDIIEMACSPKKLPESESLCLIS